MVKFCGRCLPQYRATGLYVHKASERDSNIHQGVVFRCIGRQEKHLNFLLALLQPGRNKLTILPQGGFRIAVDGKTIRGGKGDSHKAYHVVSAFAAENQLVLGEIVTDEKSNEITAVPELLDSLNIEDSIVTADAMSCQKEIVRKTRASHADYVIGLKWNQPALLEDVSLYFEHFSGELPSFVTRVKDHG